MSMPLFPLTLASPPAVSIRVKCTTDCHKPTPAQAHCPTCHATFGGVSGFDAHRYQGTCRDPRPLGYELINGVWRQPMPADVRARKAGA
jgi:hypothetical protein